MEMFEEPALTPAYVDFDDQPCVNRVGAGQGGTTRAVAVRLQSGTSVPPGGMRFITPCVSSSADAASRMAP
ncbi:hypothetical protein [Tropicibacter sp. S64]|uniref:hypothetical protein n=1 Tax=Tropicibacter sp. S64 TaxID=3415122 RepID=UPI003C7D4680